MVEPWWVSYPEPQIGRLFALATTITCASGYEVVDRQRNVNIRKGSAVEQVLLEELEILKLRESSRSLCRQDKVFARRPLDKNRYQELGSLGSSVRGLCPLDIISCFAY
jgi:hypothetical protein